MYISIHALRKESDAYTVILLTVEAATFQSTLSVRRATYQHKDT